MKYKLAAFLLASFGVHAEQNYYETWNMLAEKANTGTINAVNYVIGYAAAASDAGQDTIHCSPSISAKDVLQISDAYVRANTAMATIVANVVINKALADKFPCERKGQVKL